MDVPSIEATLREHALAIAAAAIAAVEPGRLISRQLRCLPDGAEITGARFEVQPGRLKILAVGKAASRMAAAAAESLAPLAPEGLVIVPAGTPPGPARLETLFAEHPLPGTGSSAAAHRAGALLDAADDGDLVLMLLSGGASSLLADLPAGLDARAYRRAMELLMAAGATIRELNAVRRHLGTLKGGRAVLRARPARLVALLLSDVVGSDPAVIASGLTRGRSDGDPRAIDIVRRHGLLEELPASVREGLRDPGAVGGDEEPRADDPRLAGTVERVVADNDTALAGAGAWAARCGYDVRRLRRPIIGEARSAGRRLGRLGRRIARQGGRGGPICLLGGGETVVRVTAGGRGGRNQEVVAAAAPELDGLPAVCLCSLGTDGIDGPTLAAGALATGTTLQRATERGLDPARALADNDTYPFFDALDDLVITGPTGTNVMDVQILLVGAR